MSDCNKIADFLLRLYENDSSMVSRILVARDREYKDVLRDILKVVQDEIAKMLHEPITS